MNPDLDSARRAARPALRFGWLAKGGVFVVIGLLALEVARRGFASESTDQTGALEALAGSPLGRIAVLFVSAGLLLYAVWQLWAAITQGDDAGDDDADRLLHGAKRIGWIGLAGVYAMLAVTGLQIGLRGERAASGGGDGPASPTGVSDRLFDIPGGRLIVVLIGVVTIGVGLYQLRKGLMGDALDDIETDGLGQKWRRTLTALAGAGFGARALLMGIAGWLFIDAARAGDADRAAGIDQSLDALASAPGGQLLLTVCAFGLIAAGLYDMLTFDRQRIDDV